MKKSVVASAIFCLLFCSSPACADSLIESFVKFGGFKGNGAYEGTTVSKIQGAKQSESTSVKFTGAILSWAAGGSGQTIITRVDKGVIWQIDPKDKLYTETPIALFRPEDMTAKKEETKAEKPRMRVVKSEFKVKKTGAAETINSFACEEYLMTWLVEMEDLETKARTKNTMTTNLWTTPESPAIRKVQADQTAFAKAYMKKVGMNMSPGEMKQYGMGVLSMATGASEKDMEKEFKVLKKEMSKIKGYPIRTVIGWTVEEGEVQDRQQKESSGSSESVDLSGGLGGIISEILGQKVKESVSADQNAPFFSSSVEVRKISADALPSGDFEIPAGYEKKASRD